MLETTQNKGVRLEGGHGGEVLTVACASRDKLRDLGEPTLRHRLVALAGPLLAATLSISPQPTHAANPGQDSASIENFGDPSSGEIEEGTGDYLRQSLWADTNEDSTLISSSSYELNAAAPSQDIKDHCDVVQGREGEGFVGFLVNGVLQEGEPEEGGHNYRYKAYAKAYNGKMYLCFDFPAAKGHDVRHWVAKLLGSEKRWSNGRKEVTSKNLNNCPVENPCK